MDAIIEKPAVSTLRCFERALKLDQSNVKLWIEYGTCAYMLHSHASRVLKQVDIKKIFEAITANCNLSDIQLIKCFAA